MPRNNPIFQAQDEQTPEVSSRAYRFCDLAGKTIGAYRVLSYAGSCHNHAQWRCACIYCGKEYIFRQDVLVRQKVRKCGCCPQARPPKRGGPLEVPLTAHVPSSVFVMTENGRKRARIDDTGITVDGVHYTPEESVARGWYFATRQTETVAVLSARGYSIAPSDRWRIQTFLKPETHTLLLEYCARHNRRVSDTASAGLEEWILKVCAKDAAKSSGGKQATKSPRTPGKRGRPKSSPET